MARTNGGELAGFPCPCGHLIQVIDPRPGRVLQCPECGSWQRVPILESRTAARKRASARKVSRRLDQLLLYPLRDGPGVALLVVLPPVMWLMSVPAFDVLRFLFPRDRVFNPIAMIIVPLTLPLVIGFVLFFGYVLLFLGRVLVSSSMGEIDHPRWPAWDRMEILEGAGRWLWASCFGLAIGGLPTLVYWVFCGDLDAIDWVILVELAAVGVAYAQMALAAALLHDTIIAANPVLVLQSIFRIGWSYLQPALLGAIAWVLCDAALWFALAGVANLTLAAFALWGFWVIYLYLSMVVMRAVGLTYYFHAEELGWYAARPKWGAARDNRIYVNS